MKYSTNTGITHARNNSTDEQSKYKKVPRVCKYEVININFSASNQHKLNNSIDEQAKIYRTKNN